MDGDAQSPNHEWIELVNDASVPVDVSGWTLKARDGSPSISLSGTLAPNEVVVLERTSDATVPSVSAFLIYTGALSNKGEVLELRNASGTIVDLVDGSQGWAIGGDNATKETLQRSAKTAAWFTAPPTPGILAPAPSSGSAATSSATSSSPSTGGSSSTQQATSSATQAAPSYAPTTAPLEEPLPWVVRIEVSHTTSLAGTPIRFLPRVWNKESGKLLERGFWTYWSFGDGARSREEAPTHTYRYPGTYVVALTVGREGARTTRRAQLTLTVREARLSIPEATREWITLANQSSEVADVGGWQITLTGGDSFTIPEDTLLAPGARVRFPREITGLAPNGPEEVSLSYPNGLPVALLPAASSSVSFRQAAVSKAEVPHDVPDRPHRSAHRQQQQRKAKVEQHEEEPAQKTAQGLRRDQGAHPRVRERSEAAAARGGVEQSLPDPPQLPPAEVAAAVSFSSLPKHIPLATLLFVVGGSVAVAWFLGSRFLLQAEEAISPAGDASTVSPLLGREKGAKGSKGKATQGAKSGAKERDAAAAQQEARSFHLFP